MITQIPATEVWISHLHNRINEAKKVGLLRKTDEIILSSTVLFFPSGVTKIKVDEVLPNFSIREIQGVSEKGGWVERNDLFDEAAMWIIEKYSSIEGAELYCEAGYSEAGDKILEKRQHVTFDGKPLLNNKLSKISSDVVAQTLRWARSWRVLGVVVDMSCNEIFNTVDGDRLLFLCDALDGDSIMVAMVK